MRILITEPDSYSQEAITVYKKMGEVILSNGEWENIEEVLPTVDVLVIKLKYVWSEESLKKAKKLKFIVTSTTGTNHISVPNDSNIEVISLRGEVSFLETITPTAELTWGLIITLCRKLNLALDSVQKGIWNRDEFRGLELYNSKIGIIGYGRLGKMIAKYAVAFGMEVFVCDVDSDKLTDLQHGIYRRSLREVLATSDIITIHIPYSVENHMLIDDEALSLMKKGSILVNTSRGGVVDELALLRKLENMDIWGAALDVLAGEVSGEENWINNNKLLKSSLLGERLLITPHIGGACYSSMARTELFVANKFVNRYLGEH